MKKNNKEEKEKKKKNQKTNIIFNTSKNTKRKIPPHRFGSLLRLT